MKPERSGSLGMTGDHIAKFFFLQVFLGEQQITVVQSVEKFCNCAFIYSRAIPDSAVNAFQGGEVAHAPSHSFLTPESQRELCTTSLSTKASRHTVSSVGEATVRRKWAYESIATGSHSKRPSG